MAAILIVEDDKTTNDLICDYLHDAGHSVYQAYDGKGALELFAEESIELVILDIMKESFGIAASFRKNCRKRCVGIRGYKDRF